MNTGSLSGPKCVNRFACVSHSNNTQAAKETLYWHRPFSTVVTGGFEYGDTAWFQEGGLNVRFHLLEVLMLTYTLGILQLR